MRGWGGEERGWEGEDEVTIFITVKSMLQQVVYISLLAHTHIYTY